MNLALLKPLGRFILPLLPYAALAGAVLLGVQGIWQAGYNTAWREADRAALETRLRTMEDDLRIARDAAARAETDKKELEADAAANEQVLSELRQALEGRDPATTCGIDGADLEWLLRLR